MAEDWQKIMIAQNFTQESQLKYRAQFTDMINKCHQNIANIHLNGDKDYKKAEEQIYLIMGCEPTKEFPSCKTYYLRA